MRPSQISLLLLLAASPKIRPLPEPPPPPPLLRPTGGCPGEYGGQKRARVGWAAV